MTFERLTQIAAKQAETIPQLKGLSEMIINAPNPEEARRLLVQVFAIGFAQGWTGAEKALNDDDAFHLSDKAQSLIHRMLNDEEKRLYELAQEAGRRGIREAEDALRAEARNVGALAVEFARERDNA